MEKNVGCSMRAFLAKMFNAHKKAYYMRTHWEDIAVGIRYHSIVVWIRGLNIGKDYR